MNALPTRQRQPSLLTFFGLKVNLKKCAHTALAAGSPGPEQLPLPFGPDFGPEHLPPTFGHSSPQKCPQVPWLPPHETYRYLGVELHSTGKLTPRTQPTELRSKRRTFKTQRLHFDRS